MENSSLVIRMNSNNNNKQSSKKHRLDWLSLKRFAHCVKLAITSINNSTTQSNTIIQWLYTISWLNIFYVVALFAFCIAEVYVGNGVMKQKTSFTKVIVDACLNGFNSQIRNFFVVMISIAFWLLLANSIMTIRMFLIEGISIAWRKNLTYHLQNRYLSGNTSYNMIVLDKRVDNP
jgi:ABC-type uncharacterized transport system fused permease/ATPase subunit